MPRPLVKRKPPKVSPVTISRIGAHAQSETRTAPEMARYAAKVKAVREVSSVPMDVWDEQAYLAPLLKLKADDTVTIPRYTQEVWWFVQDVNGPERLVTADTLLFGGRFERSFPFSWVMPRSLEGRDEACEAAVALVTLKQQRARHSGQPVGLRS